MSSSPPADPVAAESPAASPAPSPGAGEDVSIEASGAPEDDNNAGSDVGHNGDAPDPTADDANDDDDDDEEGAYVPATESSAARIPSFKKRRGSGEPEGEDGEDQDEERQRRKKKKRDARAERRARAEAEEEDAEEPQMDEATRRRRELEERIEAIGKSNRAPRRKKKGDDIDVSGRGDVWKS